MKRTKLIKLILPVELHYLCFPELRQNIYVKPFVRVWISDLIQTNGIDKVGEYNFVEITSNK